MPVESDKSGVVTRNFVGARGIDAIVTTNSSGTTTAYPLYDCHGNMVATLANSGSGWSTGNVREYDVWGSVRTGATSGGPVGRYCANLGHVADDESGLIYMRARYYEPSSGRFISEDPARDGFHLYDYFRNAPTIYVYFSGQAPLADHLISVALGIAEEGPEVEKDAAAATAAVRPLSGGSAGVARIANRIGSIPELSRNELTKLTLKAIDEWKKAYRGIGNATGRNPDDFIGSNGVFICASIGNIIGLTSDLIYNRR